MASSFKYIKKHIHEENIPEDLNVDEKTNVSSGPLNKFKSTKNLLACLEGEFRVAKLQLTSATESKG
jgi:hypothetical protein